MLLGKHYVEQTVYNQTNKLIAYKQTTVTLLACSPFLFHIVIGLSLVCVSLVLLYLLSWVVFFLVSFSVGA